MLPLMRWDCRLTFQISLVPVVCMHLICFVQPIYAAITWSGDIDPANPTTWNTNTYGYIGKSGSGTLDITGGGAVSNSSGEIGYKSGSAGYVTVDGTGSTWTISGWFTVGLTVGNSGSGTLNITDFGAVTVEKNTFVAKNAGSFGMLLFDKGTLMTGGLLCDTDDLTGTGTINTHGLIGDVDLIFDSTHGLNQTFNINDNTGQNIIVNLDVDGSGTMGAGYSGIETMSISDGRIIQSTDGYIGYKSGSMGEVAVNGGGSTWTNSASLTVGHFGNGTLNITGGGAVSNSYSYIGDEVGSTGEVKVDGADSTWTSNGKFTVGLSGSGTLNITGGGAVSNSSSCFIGGNSGSTGVVTVDGAGSTWTNSSAYFYVGHSGNGTLNITGGGAVSNSLWGTIGNYSGSTGVVTVDGAGSTWTNSGTLTVGNSGSGTLNITDGGAVSNSYSYIGNQYDSTSVVTVDGAGSTWTNSALFYVGHSGNGTLNITGGGAVSISSNGTIGYNTNSMGEVTVRGAGSTWTNYEDLYVGWYGYGTMNITDGGLVSVAGTLSINRYGVVDSFINMATGSMLALLGEADGSLLDFLGLIDGTDAIRYWDESISDWSDITGATYGDDYTLDFLTEGDLAGYTMLTVYTPEPGADFDGDGDVDGADFLVWQRGESPNPLSSSDLTIWRAHFGDIDSSIAAASITIPEPSSIVMLLAAFTCILSRRRT
jgi:T5SS/PEP-CTERM-associated repeat protein